MSGTRTIFLTVLRDKMGFDEDQLVIFWGHVKSLSEEILDRRVSINDLRRVLLEEAGIRL